MKRILTYVAAGLGIVAGFCIAFTIVVVLVAKDGDTGPRIAEKWMPYISLIIVIAVPAILVWAVFRFGRNFIFKKIKKGKPH